MGDPRSVPETGAAALFTQALEQLDDYVEAEPDTPHRKFIDDIRLSNIRRLLGQLSRVRAGDLGNWAGYTAVLSSVPGLDAFVDVHR